MDKLQELAEVIHDVTCRYNHTDQCGWFYETHGGVPDWDRWTHKRYLAKAENLYTTVSPQSSSSIIEIVKALKGL